MTGFNGAVEAGWEVLKVPCLAHLTPVEGVTVNLCTVNTITLGRKYRNKDVQIMKITEQFVIAWIRNEEASADELVAVHSHPINSSDADEAWRKFENGKAIEGFIPIVFLDEQLNSSVLRSWLQAEAIHRCHLM
jgi:hypothetical protein